MTKIQEALDALEEVKQAINSAYASGYAAGSEARQWVGLTDEEAAWCQAPSTSETWKRIEAKLKEKNT